MHLGEGQQPIGALVVMALHRAKAFECLKEEDFKGRVVIDDDCKDPSTIRNRDRRICTLAGEHNVVRSDDLGGSVLYSEHCPGYTPEFYEHAIQDYLGVIDVLGASVIVHSSHGEHCALCAKRGITVGQRIWLSIDAQRRFQRDPRMPAGLNYKLTYHRKYMKDGQEHQKTRGINPDLPIFREIPMTQIMTMTDYDLVEMLAPDLLERVAV